MSWVPRSAYHVLGECELCKRTDRAVFGLHSSIADLRYNGFKHHGAPNKGRETDSEWRAIKDNLRTDTYRKRKRRT